MISTGDSGRTRRLNQLGDATVSNPVTGDILEFNATQGAFLNTGGAAGGIVTLNGVQTLTNKTLIDASTFIADDIDPTKLAQFQCAGITTGTTRTFTFPDANAVLVGTTLNQLLTNKSLTDSNTFFVDSGDPTKRSQMQLDGITTATVRTISYPDSDGTMVLRDLAQTLTNKSFQDNTTSFLDNVDPTKIAQFQASNITTGTTRTYSFPDVSSTLVAVDGAQTVLSKVLTFATITSSTNDVVANGLRNAAATEVATDGNTPTAGDVLVASSATEAFWDTPALSPGYLEGWPLNWTSATVVTIGDGNKSAATDIDDSFDFVDSGAISIDITVGGAGGLNLLDTEAANTWYFVYIIGDSSNVNPIDGMLADTFLTTISSANAVGYDRLRWVGTVRNDASSDIKDFHQVCTSGWCRTMMYNDDVANLRAITGAGSTLVFTNLVVTGFVPPQSRRCILNVTYEPGVVGERFFIIGDSTLTPTQAPLNFFGLVVGVKQSHIVETACTASQIIRWSGTLSGSDLIDIDVIGYEEWLRS